MSNETAALVMVVDSSGVKTAAVDLDKLVATAERVEDVSNRVTQASAKTSAAYTGVSQATNTVNASAERYIKAMQAEFDMLGRTRAEMERYNAIANGLSGTALAQVEAIAKKIDAYHREEQAMKDLAGTQDKATAAAEKFIAQLKYEAETANLTTKELYAYRAAKLGVSDAAAPLIAAMKESGHAMDGFSLSSSVAKRELVVMSRELARGDFTRFGSSFSIFAQSSGLLTLALSPLGLAIGAVAVGAGALAVAFYQGASESKAYTEALINTGNYAGVTKGQFTDMSAVVAQSIGTQHEAADALAQLGATGRISGSDMTAFATTAVRASEVTGVAIKDTVAEFVKLGQDPVKESARLNESMHYLTSSVFEQINSLVQLGKTDEAATLAQKTYADAVDDRTKQVKASLGYLESGWHSIGKAASNAWSSMMGVGRDLSVGDQIAKLQSQIVSGQAGSKAGSIFDKGPAGAGSFNDEQNKKIQEQIALLQSAGRESKKFADMEGERAKTQGAAVEAQKLVNASLDTYASKSEKMQKEIDSTQRAFAAIRAADPASDLLKKESGLLDEIQAKYAEKPKAQKAVSDAYGSMLASIDKATQAALQELDTGEKLTAADRFRIQSLSQIEEALRKKNITLNQAVDLESRANDTEALMAGVIAANDARKATEELAKAHQQYIDTLQNGVDKIQADIEKQRQQTAELGLSKEAIAGLRAAEMERQVAAAEGVAVDALVNNQGADTVRLLIERTEKLRELAVATREGGAAQTAADLAKKTQTDQVKLLESVDKAAESAFVNIAENGTNAFKKIGQTLQTAVLDLLYQLTVKQFVVNIAASVTGASATSIAQAAGSGVSNFGSLASNANSLYSAFSGGGIGSTAAGLVGSGTSAVFGSVAGNAALGGTLGLGAGSATAAATAAAEAAGATITTAATATASAAGSIGASLAAAGPYVAAALAVYTIAKLAFGRGPKEVTDSGISGTFGAAGANVQNFSDYTQKGGWFTSDKKGTDYSAVASSTQTFLDKSLASITSTTQAYATVIGLSADAVAGFTQDVRIDLKGLDAKGQQDAINKAFGAFADGMAGVYPQLIGFGKEGESASTTLARLSTSLLGVNNLLSTMRLRLFSVSVSSADAASQLADAFGGLDKLTSASKTYYDAFYTEAERAKNSTQDIAAALAAINITAPKTKDEFRGLVDGLDLNTASGRAAYATLIQLAPEFSSNAAVASKFATETANKLLATFTGNGQLPGVLNDSQAKTLALASSIGNDLGASLSQTQQAALNVSAGFVHAFSDTGQFASGLLGLGSVFAMTQGNAAGLSGQVSGLALNSSATESVVFGLRGQVYGLSLNADGTANAVGGMRQSVAAAGGTAGAVSSLFLDANAKLLTFGSSTAQVTPLFTSAQIAGQQLTGQIESLRSSADKTVINITGLSAAIQNVDTETFVNVIAGVFTSLATRIKSVVDSVNAERVAVREAALQIINPTVMSKDAISRAISGVSLAVPGNSGLAAADNSLRGADEVVAWETAQLTRAKAASPDRSALDAANGQLAGATQATSAIESAINTYRTIEGGKFAQYVDQALQGIDRRGNLPNPSGERNAQDVGFSLAPAQAVQARAQALYDQQAAAFGQSSQQYANNVAYVQAALDRATAAQAAAASRAKTEQLAYIDALQSFTIDASKSVTRLSKLREETVKYYDAQKQLADLMSKSAAGLRTSVSDYRYNQLDPVAQFNTLQTNYATAYSMALSTSGEDLVGYGDKLNNLLNPLLAKAKEVLTSDSAYQAFADTALARAENIAGRLEQYTPTDYAADSLALLGQIDATLSVLDASSKSAEKIISDAVTASADRNAAGQRAIIAVLAGQPVQAFATGGAFTNGIVSRPTLFNTALMGEGGQSEAIMPLTNIGGQLGVRAVSGSNASQINTARLEALTERLLAKVDELNATNMALAVSNAQMQKLFARLSPDGDALQTRAVVDAA